MNDTVNWKKRFNELRTCVLIPTYNNSTTLGRVIEALCAYTDNIIVVNDGSNDDTRQVLASFPFLRVISYDENKGKGWALRKGFEYVSKLGFEYAITIDSDGQHFAKDLPSFLDKLSSSDGNMLIIGARNMKQDSVPGKSSFGHKFSNFWFRVETGIHAPDTQSGYRLYPVSRFKGMHFITRKYEFEIEVLVRSAWKGIRIYSVPISVYYPPHGERITHFRPFRDFTRISILNTVLVFITFIYIKPRDFLRRFFQKKKLDGLLNKKRQVPEPGHLPFSKENQTRLPN